MKECNILGVNVNLSIYIFVLLFINFTNEKTVRCVLSISTLNIYFESKNNSYII